MWYSTRCGTWLVDSAFSLSTPSIDNVTLSFLLLFLFFSLAQVNRVVVRAAKESRAESQARSELTTLDTRD